MTTTGYGEDAPWQTPQMHLLVIVMQFAGIGLILTAADVLAVPWFQETFTPTAPESIAAVEGHVVLCGYSPRTDAFISELDTRGQPYVLIEPDPDQAQELDEKGYQVIYGDPESTETLTAAHVGTARALVADAADDTNASIVLAALDVRSDLRVVTLVEDADLARYHEAAGATAVLSPRQLLGESLASEVPTAISTAIDDEITIGEDFELLELAVAEGSELCYQRFEDASIRDRYGVNVIGGWFEGEFHTPVPPDAELEAGSRLLVVGQTEELEEIREATSATVRRYSARDIILAGYGDSGEAAYGVLEGTSSTLTVLDSSDIEGVDVVGDARDPEVLDSVGIADASTLLITVGDDTTAIFTTLIARDRNPDLQIIVRANEDENVQKLYRAGADYVQSLATVSGRMLASTVFEDETVLAYDTQINVVRFPANGLAREALTARDVRSRTGCTVVAIVRDQKSITDFDPDRSRSSQLMTSLSSGQTKQSLASNSSF
ncbi:MAG: NAD-binding protein [Natrialbaceae archaeon]|nr:NAD-binding protein [Natrialbaceae archaeon]